jgi:hypothetical protein
MFSKTLGISLMASAWMLAFAGIFIWSLEAPFGDFWHMDHLSVLATIANAVFITALVCYDECFGIAKPQAYVEYCEYAKSRGFQPMGLEAFEALHRAGFDPVTKLWS